jgi:hypothetical protein
MSNKNEKRREKREWIERRKRSFSNCIAIEKPNLCKLATVAVRWELMKQMPSKSLVPLLVALTVSLVAIDSTDGPPMINIELGYTEKDVSAIRGLDSPKQESRQKVPLEWSQV